jgi:hypothetical protein
VKQCCAPTQYQWLCHFIEYALASLKEKVRYAGWW